MDLAKAYPSAPSRVTPPSAVVDAWTVTGHVLSSGMLRFEKSCIGTGCEIRRGCIVWAGMDIGDGAVLLEQSCMPPAGRVPPNQVWAGNPAMRSRRFQAALHAASSSVNSRKDLPEESNAGTHVSIEVSEVGPTNHNVVPN